MKAQKNNKSPDETFDTAEYQEAYGSRELAPLPQVNRDHSLEG